MTFGLNQLKSRRSHLFTYSERNVRKHDTNFVLKQAQGVLKLKGYSQVCVDKLYEYRLDSDSVTLLTTEQASTLIQAIVDDTIYYEGGWM